jgi:hypothetical protein
VLEAEVLLEDLVTGEDPLSRVPHQSSGDVQKNHKEQEDSDVQGSMKPTHRRRSYLGKRRIEGRIS